MLRSLLITATALSVAAVAAPAAAESTRYVSYGDLDLSNSAGRTTLRQRLTTAVEQVCGKVEVRVIQSGQAVEECRTDTWTMVQPQLNAVLGATVEVLADARIAIQKPTRSRS